MDLVEIIAAEHGISSENLLFKFLRGETKAREGGKARECRANLYTLCILAEDFIEGKITRYKDLLARIKAIPLGAKLQNHSVDNRLNGKFKNLLKVTDDLLPIVKIEEEGENCRVFCKDLLSHGGTDPKTCARFVAGVVRTYIKTILANQETTLKKIASINSLEDLTDYFKDALAPDSNARTFEIASYALLAEHYREQSILIGDSPDNLETVQLKLFRTGRTNANDGGIDFVLQPHGRFFQVTEETNFKKYFLDFEKVNRYPISFVVKQDKDVETVRKKIRERAEKSKSYTAAEIDGYMELFEEIITLRDLHDRMKKIPESALKRVKEDLYRQFQLEYGLLDKVS